MSRVVILSAVRTPGGRFGGSLSSFTAAELGAIAIREAIIRANIPIEVIGEVIMGNAWQAGVGPNVARISAIFAGLPESVSAFTVNKRCGSGLKAVMLGADAILLGREKVVVAGGTEATSQVPYILQGARWGYKMGHQEIYDALHKDGFFCPMANMMMGATAEILVQEYNISRREQDEYALESHRRAIHAIDSGKFNEEIVPVEVKDKTGTFLFKQDEIPRRDTSLEKLAKLPPVFKENGTITAGTSSALCDAAAAVVLADEDWAKAEGLKPLARILSYTSIGIAPDHMGLGPVKAVPKALSLAGISLKDIDLIELNEAFAAQVIAVERELGLDHTKVNIHGGAIALGHPIGATGSKILTTLIHALKTYDKQFGLVTLCIGGGQGIAMVIERL
ncbi:MAG: thiolase family protein [Synergistetes bacterium]|nr:thiolase family protein [Synergistota bacterium]MCX8128131.1 thiolase family protein [Synergistota bacterium]MDW8192507.1 thiolase family protein [Synergistota bacterium]